jgi:hypothetical protein
MENLFDDIERTSLEPSNLNESEFDYYNRSARKDIQTIRTKLEEWFRLIPDCEKNEIKSRIKKKFDDVFYELFLYNLFANLGFQITIHPTVPSSNNKPDFLIKKGDLEIYVEAKISKGKSNKEEALERMKNHFYDAINRISTENFILQIEELQFISCNQPQTKNIVSKIENILDSLDPDMVEENTKTNGYRDYKIEYNDQDIHLVLNPLAVSKSKRGKSSRRAVGVFPIEIFYGGGEESIRESINRKAKRYGDLDKPFIICINALSFKTSSSDDVDSAIWGTLAFPIDDNQSSSVKNSVHKPDGVFYDKNGPRRKHLTAVLVNKVFPSNIPSSEYWFYKNPFSKHQIDFNDLGLKLNYVKDNYVESITGDDLDIIFKMKKNWLES